ncbi:MAG: hypothetical protein V1793_07955 [Pseudomonadota bacterium]
MRIKIGSMLSHVHIPDQIDSGADLTLTPKGRLDSQGVSRIWDQAMAAGSRPGARGLTIDLSSRDYRDPAGFIAIINTINSDMCNLNEKP